MSRAHEIARRYPRLRARLDTPAAEGYAAAPDAAFDSGLRALLDGLEGQLAA
jgi:hypothetical protein